MWIKTREMLCRPTDRSRSVGRPRSLVVNKMWPHSWPIRLLRLTHGTLAQRDKARERLVTWQLHQQLVLRLTETDQLREKQLVFHGVHVDREEAWLERRTECVTFLHQWQRTMIWLAFEMIQANAQTDRQTALAFYAILVDHITPAFDVVSRHRLRSANRHRLIVPRCRLNTYGRPWAFPVAGPMVWNSLQPDELRDPACDVDSFKQFFKTILFSSY